MCKNVFIDLNSRLLHIKSSKKKKHISYVLHEILFMGGQDFTRLNAISRISLEKKRSTFWLSDPPHENPGYGPAYVPSGIVLLIVG